jgi:hypothetical protein
MEAELYTCFAPYIYFNVKSYLNMLRTTSSASHHQEEIYTTPRTNSGGHASINTDKWRPVHTRYTALNEQPGHEMKPLLSSRNPHVTCGQGRVPAE